MAEPSASDRARDLLAALEAIAYVTDFVRGRTPPDADAARTHIAAYDWLTQFRGSVEANYRAAVAEIPLAAAAQVVKDAEPLPAHLREPAPLGEHLSKHRIPRERTPL